MLSKLLAVLALTLAVSTAFAAEPAPAPGRPIVIGQSYELASSVLHDTRRINVYLPAGYKDPTKRFAVLYLLDGGEAEDFHHITGLAQVAAFNGATQELIVVGIEGVDRKHDLTYPSKDPRDLKDVPTSGGSAAYRRFLVDEVKPWVTARYRTNGHSALIGESLAGLFVAETFLRAPTSFDDYIAISPSLWWDNENLSREAAADLRAGDFKGRQLYLSIGNEGAEMQSAVDRLVAALGETKPSGLISTYAPRPEERHDTIYDPAALAAIRTLYPVAPKP
jgi:predicted alpha/beta superfamily hydrolase